MSLIAFYVSCFLAFIAGHMLNYTAILFALEFFESSTIAGIAYGLCFGPPIIFGWIAGAYIDRYGAKTVLLLAQNLFILGGLGMLLVIVIQPSYSLLLFLLSNVLVGIAWAFVAPARYACLGQYMSVDRLGQSTITLNLLVMLGFGLAPIILTQIESHLSWQWVAIIAVSMFTLSSLMLVNAPNQHIRLTHQNLKQEWHDCFSQLKQFPVITQLLLAAIIGYLLMGPMQVVLPQIAKINLQLNTVEIGQYLGLIAVALIVGGLLAMKLKHVVHIGKSIALLLLLAGIFVALLGRIELVWLSCIVLLVGTTMAGVIVSFIVAGLQHNTPQAIRGRVMSMYTIISQVISAIAGVLAGTIADIFSPSVSLYLVGAIFVVASLVLALKAKALMEFKRL
ncbi:MFS transporter [Bermanella sp. R86510]|uniref:MFS transporter n=1 Tax=unclassified Bermanella TaxID=2627862 RepID=UPI0037C6D981